MIPFAVPAGLGIIQQMKYFCLGLVTYKQGLMEIMIETFGTVISQNRIDWGGEESSSS